MSTETHVEEDEELLDEVTVGEWTWACTDRRIFRYLDDGAIVDVPLDDITRVNLVHAGRDTRLGAAGGIASLLGLGLLPRGNIFVLLLAAGLVLLFLWYRSQTSYFVFSGTEESEDDPGEWRLDVSGADDPDEVRSFVGTVRNQL